MSTTCAPSGGAFLIEDVSPDQILIPEELPAEARLMAKTVDDFMRKEVLPNIERIEAKEPGLMPSLVKKAAGLGLLGTSVPEKYNGIDLKKSWNTLIVEKM